MNEGEWKYKEWMDEWKYGYVWEGMGENKYKYVNMRRKEISIWRMGEYVKNELTFPHHEKNGRSHPSTPPKTD